MKRCTTMVIGSLVGTSLLLVGVSVMSVAHHERPNGNTRSQIQPQVSDLEKDQSTFASDMKQLRRDLRYHASAVTVAKDRNFVRQDLLNIVLDRWEPAAQEARYRQASRRQPDGEGAGERGGRAVTDTGVDEAADAPHDEAELDGHGEHDGQPPPPDARRCRLRRCGFCRRRERAKPCSSHPGDSVRGSRHGKQRVSVAARAAGDG